MYIEAIRLEILQLTHPPSKSLILQNDLDSPVNVAISLTASLESLLILVALQAFRIIPIYDAPNDDMINRIQTSHDKFASKYEISIDDYSSIKTGKLFLGATAYAHTENNGLSDTT